MKWNVFSNCKIMFCGLLFSASAQAGSPQNYQAAQAIQNFSNKTQAKSSPTCPLKDGACTQIMKTLISNDKEDLLAGLLKSRYKTCQGYLGDENKSSAFSSSKDLALHFEKYQGANLGPLVQSQIRRCLGPDDQKSKEAIAKYYYYFERIEKGEASQLEEMATSDLVLGKPALSEITCGNLGFASLKARCEQIKSGCKDLGSLQSIVDKTKNAQDEIADLEAQKKPIQEKFDKMVRRTQLSSVGDDLVKKIQALDLRINQIKSQNSWMNGPEFQKAMKSGAKLSEAIKNQLSSNRNELKNNFIDGEVMQNCLSGAAFKGCSADKVRDFIDKMPELPDVIDFNAGANKAQAVAGSQYMQFEQCVHEGTQDKEKTSSILKGAAFDAGTVVLTAGLGSIIAAPKALLGARELATLRYAKIADSALNTGNFAVGVSEAAKKCSGKVGIEKQNDQSNNQCQLKSIYQGSQAVKLYDDCVSSAVMAAAGLAPLATGKAFSKLNPSGKARTLEEQAGVSKAITQARNEGQSQEQVLSKMKQFNDKVDGGKARLDQAEQILGRKLTKEEKDWIMAAHNTHGDLAYGKIGSNNVRDKLKAGGGRPDSLNAKDTRALMENGVLGNGDGLVPREKFSVRDGRVPSAEQRKSFSTIAADREEAGMKSATSSSEGGIKSMMEEFAQSAEAEKQIVRPSAVEALDRPLAVSKSIIRRARGGDHNSVVEDLSESMDKVSKMKSSGVPGGVAGKPYTELIERESEALKSQAEYSMKLYQSESRDRQYAGGAFEAWQLMRTRVELSRHNLEIAERTKGANVKYWDDQLDKTAQELSDFVQQQKINNSVIKWEKAERVLKGY